MSGRAAKQRDKGFLSRDIEVRDLILNKSDLHHLFPRGMLKKQGLSRGRYNQIANVVVAQKVGKGRPQDGRRRRPARRRARRCRRGSGPRRDPA